MSQNEEQTPIALGEIEHGPSKFEQFLDNNQRSLIAVGIAAVVILASVIIFKGVSENNRQTASAALIDSKTSDSLEKLNKDHPNTPAGGTALLRLANNQWENENKDLAISTLESFVSNYEKHPAHLAALTNLGSKQALIGKSEEAMENLETVIETEDPTFAPLAQFLLADLNAQKGNKQEAAKLFTELSSQPELNLGQLKSLSESRQRGLSAPTPDIIKPQPVEKKETPSKVKSNEKDSASEKN